MSKSFTIHQFVPTFIGTIPYCSRSLCSQYSCGNDTVGEELCSLQKDSEALHYCKPALELLKDVINIKS